MTQYDEAGNVKVALGNAVTVDESPGFGKEPPRILVAVNEAVPEYPEGTKFEADIGVKHELTNFGADEIKEILVAIRKGLDVSYDKLWETQAPQLEVGWGSDELEERWAKLVSERYSGITYGGPGPSYFSDPVWEPYVLSRAQPKMRKLTAYRFQVTEQQKPKVVVRGNTQIADYPATLADPPAGTDPGFWDPADVPVIDGQPPKADAAPDPAKPPIFGDFEDNPDPAVPIIGACQQTTSYGAIARGLTCEDDLNYGGYAASEATGGLSIFTGKAARPGAVEPTPKGVFYTAGSKLADGKVIESREDMHALLKPSYSLDKSKLNPPIGPGSVVCYNPHAFMKEAFASIIKFEAENWGASMKVRATICREIKGNPKGPNSYWPTRTAPLPTAAEIEAAEPVPNPKRKDGESEAAFQTRRDAEIDKRNKRVAAYLADLRAPSYFTHTIQLSKNVQDPGSHICYVLRVTNDEDPKNRRLQLFDTSSHIAYWVMEVQNRRGLVARPQQGGIMEGCAIPSPYRPGEMGSIPVTIAVTGIGVVPPIDPAKGGAALDALENARPVGLVRLVLTLRKPPPEPKKPVPGAPAPKKPKGLDLGPDLFPNPWALASAVQKAEILYVSRMLRMYGDEPAQNFYLTRLLWSLRHTPYFTNIQPWWFVFAPTTLFARAMWAKGARKLRPRDFVAQVLKNPKYHERKVKPGSADWWAGRNDLRIDQHYMLTHVITNCGTDRPERAGRSFFWCRNRSSLSDGGSTSMKVDGYSPPGAIMKVLKELGVDGEYVHADIGKPGDVVPAPTAGKRAGDDPLDYFVYG